ncbi:DUF2169 family type VI secretion system accessory protein [Nannocystis radixulma]|uniref:DUF2169 domain-containing protein n=1 Tax=Nannocystis radixulma TaxID=2995305 RepID=A0ABT5BBW9_9BACT|nr:DUF2169 domain-containing protein [Nannocystis radixulma]MDC0671630.1 DUF2169 domain-containing protein [Nannocystis radixulma]
MQFFNDTPLASSLVRAQLFYRDLLQAIVVVKGTFAVASTGEVSLCDAQPPVLLEDTETELGTLDCEIVPVKAGCDAAVLGHARSPDPRQPVEALEVSLTIGRFERRVAVSGDREWVRTLTGLRPSRPQPFTSMPLTYARSFGGRAMTNHNVVGAYFDNPDGRGYVVQKEAVAGAPLPNVEEVDDLVTEWDQRPRVAGMGPVSRQSTLRSMRGISVDVEAQTTRIEPAMFTFSHPRMALPAYPAGELVTLTGMRHGAPWTFNLPAFQYWLEVDLGGRLYQLPMSVDTLYLLPDEGKFSVVARRALIYQFLPERLRSLRVLGAKATAPRARTTTIRQLRAQLSDEVPICIESSTELDLPLDMLVANHPMTDILENLPLCPSG